MSPSSRLAEVETLGAEVDRGAPAGKPPRQERAAIDGVLEPGVEFGRDVAVQKHLHGLLLLAREFADLQAAHVRRGFPIDVVRAFERLVGPDAVEVLAQPAVVRFDLTGHPEQQIFEAGLRVEGRIDHRFAAQRDARRLLQEAERERGG